MDKFAIDLSSITLISLADLDAMDLGTAIQLVQGQRAALLEEQLKGQLKEIQDRNRTISNLNATMSSARELMAQFGQDDKTGKTIDDLIKDQRKELKDSDYWKEIQEQRKSERFSEKEKLTPVLNEILRDSRNELKKIEDHFKNEHANSDRKGESYETYFMRVALNRKDEPLVQEFWLHRGKQMDAEKKLAQLEKPEPKDPENDDTKAGKMLENLKASAVAAGMTLNLDNKGELQALVEKIKSEIDSLSNDQNLDMLRLQSYSTKYNDTFDARTNALKQEHDMHSRIQSNMRSA